MTLEEGAKVYHGGHKYPIELVTFIETWHGEEVWVVRELKTGGNVHIETFSKGDKLAPYKGGT